MQRKNYLLKRTCRSQKRNAMAMMMALGVIVVISTIMALSLALTNQTTQKTINHYLHEQSILLSKSATEYALLEISQNGCLANGGANLNFTQDTIYEINITTRYIGTEASPCTDYITTIVTPEQNGSVLLDVTVSVTDTTVVNEPIRFFRRSIQKL